MEVLPRGVKRLFLPQKVDERGCLTFLEGGRHIPFKVERVFWITDVPAEKTRGGHAHWTCHEAIFCVAGSLDIELDDGEQAVVVRLDDSRNGITVPAGVWCELRHFSPGTVCVVMASQEFDASGYAHTKEDWLSSIKNHSELQAVQ